MLDSSKLNLGLGPEPGLRKSFIKSIPARLSRVDEFPAFLIVFSRRSWYGDSGIIPFVLHTF